MPMYRITGRSSGDKWWVPVRSKCIYIFMAELRWRFSFKWTSIKTRRIIFMILVDLVFELTNDILYRYWQKNKAWYQTKKYYTHQNQNQQTFHQQTSICILELCSSEKKHLDLITPNLYISADEVIWHLPDVFDFYHREPTCRHSKAPRKIHKLLFQHRMWSRYRRQLRLQYFITCNAKRIS